jgi:hypothetical protein
MGEKITMLDKNDIPFVPTHKHNSSIRKSDNTIENLTEHFTKLQRENRHLITARRGIRTLIFRTKEEKLQDEHNLESTTGTNFTSSSYFASLSFDSVRDSYTLVK